MSLCHAPQLTALMVFLIRPDTQHVAALTQLRELSLDSCSLDDAAVCRLSSLSHLRTLALQGNEEVTGAQGSMEVLASSMPHLTTLVVTGRRSVRQAAEQAFEQRSTHVVTHTLPIWRPGA